jgi:hypothetical protein
VLHAYHIVWGPFGETIGNLVFCILFIFLCGFIFLSWRSSFSLVYYGELGVILKWKLIFCCKTRLARNFEIIFPYVCGFAPLLTQFLFELFPLFALQFGKLCPHQLSSFMKEWPSFGQWMSAWSLIIYFKNVFPNDYVPMRSEGMLFFLIACIHL